MAGGPGRRRRIEAGMWTIEDLDEAELAILSERERKVLRIRFGLPVGRPATLKETGEAIGVGRERARRIQNEALAKLNRKRDPNWPNSKRPGPDSNRRLPT